MHNNNIYNENLKISAAWQHFIVRGIVSVTAWARNLEETLLMMYAMGLQPAAHQDVLCGPATFVNYVYTIKITQ
jgi:hypothetical protein